MTGLTVEVRIQQDCARLRTGACELGEHGRSLGRIVDPPHLETALRERLLEEGRVALDVGRLVRDVGEREQVEKFRPILLRVACDVGAQRARVRALHENDDRHEQCRAHGLLRCGMAHES
jgi:hypothetical protein